MDGREKSRDERGQAMVESAIIIPMYVFLILGLLQLGLIHQARLMTKYAAYKAVRAGALHSADNDAMRETALWALMPLISKNVSDVEVIKPVASPMDYEMKWLEFGVARQGKMLPMPMQYVEVATCGPTQDALPWKTKEVDFDDPKIASAAVGKRDNSNWKKSERTKLRVQVTFNYRMPIPFANALFHYMAFGKEITRAMYLGGNHASQRAQGMQRRQKALNDGLMVYDTMGSQGIYVWPIRASYSMRMQSNLYKNNLPNSNGSGINGDCVARWL